MVLEMETTPSATTITKQRRVAYRRDIDNVREIFQEFFQASEFFFQPRSKVRESSDFTQHLANFSYGQGAAIGEDLTAESEQGTLREHILQNQIRVQDILPDCT